jgi:hypothetical protein
VFLPDGTNVNHTLVKDSWCGWKVPLNITLPRRVWSETIHEKYLDEKQHFLTQSEPHKAGFEYGRIIIDKWIQEHSN